jgi:hypothetical protein
MSRRHPGALAILALLLAASRVGATEVACSDRVSLSNLDLRYCSNHCYRSDTEVLYYRGLAEALNAYAGHRREEGALQAKTLTIEAQPVSSNAGPAIRLTQSPRSYDVEFRYGYTPQWGCEGISGLRAFVRIVDYFAAKSWKSFCYDYQTVSCGAALRTFGQLLDREAGQPDMSFFAGWRTVVYKVDDLLIVYEDDRLYYELAGRKLDLLPGDPLPVKVGERYVFGSQDAIHVYENGSEILRKAWKQQPDFGPFRARAFRTWVNLGYSGGPKLSYSSAENRFHEVPDEARLQGGFGDFGGCVVPTPD